MNTAEQPTGITALRQEIISHLNKGLLSIADVERALQGIVDGKAPHWNPPNWWRAPEQQLERARQLWPNTVLPSPPKEFTPLAKSEVLLLHVPDSFDFLWDKVIPPCGYTKSRRRDVRSDRRTLRLAPHKFEYTQPVWLAFDPIHGMGQHPNSLERVANLAASEVLSALVQFPGWPLSWLNGAPAPSLSGYRLYHGSGQLYVPYLCIWSNTRQLELTDDSPGSINACSLPSVRAC